MEACRKDVKGVVEMISQKSQIYSRIYNISQYLDRPLLLTGANQLRRKAAAGTDRVSPKWYRENLDININKLIEEVKNKTYQPYPARRVSIPKDDGSLRYLGIPATRDKHLQGAVLTLLEAIYEQHFYSHSYGFRPKRSAQMALRSLLDWLAPRKGAWVLEVDLSKFFDTIPHDRLLEVISERIGDQKILHLIHAWLKAGYKEKGVVVPSETGTPQGGVISPLAANVYLDKVLDQWITREYLPTLRGEGFLVRYADDFVLAFTDEAECRQADRDITARVEEFGLRVNRDKTRITDLRRPCAEPPDTQEKAEIHFLGFSVYWKTCPNTGWQLAVRTSTKSIKRFEERLSSWLEMCGDLTPGDLMDRLEAKVRGHRGYFGVEGNEDMLDLVEDMVRTRCRVSFPMSSEADTDSSLP